MKLRPRVPPYAKKHQTPIGGNEPKIQRGHGPEKKAVDRRDDRIPPQQVQRRLRGLEAVERHVGKRIMNRKFPEKRPATGVDMPKEHLQRANRKGISSA